MRTNTITITSDFRFIVGGGIECVAGKSAYVILGSKSGPQGETRIPVGMDFAKTLPESKPCPRDGDGSLGLCSECGTLITRGDIKVVEETVGFFKQERPTAKHQGVRIMHRASGFLTRRNSALMVAEERMDSGELMVLFHVEGGSPQLWLDAETEERKPFNRQAKRYEGRQIVGLDAFIVLRKGDKIEIARSSNEWHEQIVVLVTDDLQIKLGSVLRSEVTKESAPEETPEVEEVVAEEVAEEVVEEPLKEEESSEIKFE
jgi:hypothetical protein